MDSWFGKTSAYYFEPFSVSHITMLSAAFACLILLLLFKNRLQPASKFFQWLRWILFSLLLLSEISYQIWAITSGVWSFQGHVPLHLCGIASITAMIGLLTFNKTWIRISFFIGILPAFLALITPELPYDYQHYRFWKFFIHHTAIPVACLFLALSKPSVITLRSVFFVYFLLILYALIIGFIINPITGANYLYLAQLPTASTPLSFFGDGIWYYLNLGLAALAIFLLQYFTWRRFILKKI